MKRFICALLLAVLFVVAQPVSAVVRNPHGYALQFHTGAFSPADATTYFFGDIFSLGATTTAALQAIFIPKSGTITKASLQFRIFGTLGSATPTSTVSLRLNNTTDTTISSAIASNGALQTVNTTFATPVAVAAGDFFEIKWVAPTWATNPTNVTASGWIYIDVP